METSQTPAAAKPRPIFRQEALQRYMLGRQRLILPRYTAQSTAVLMWTLVIVLGVGGVAIALAPVPVLSSGSAIIDRSSGHAVVFLAPEALSRLRPGQPVKLWLNANTTALTQPIEHVEPRLVSPEDARRRYQLDGAATLAITRPAAVVTLSVPSAIDRHAYAGSIVPATVQTGVERVASRLSALGQRGGE